MTAAMATAAARAGRLPGVMILSYTGVMTMTEHTGRGTGRRERRWRMLRWAAGAVLLSVPWVMMQVSTEWNWRPESFLVFGAMLAVALGAYELAVRISDSAAYRIAVGLSIVAAFALVWMNLAVGIIGSEDNPANLMYVGVLAVGAIGAILACGRPGAMARALLATALAQAVLAVVALTVWRHEPPGPMPILALNGAFVVVFLGAAGLFRRADRGRIATEAGF